MSAVPASGPLEALFSRWAELPFREFSASALQLGGLSSERINAILSGVLQQKDDKVISSWIRLVVALHFQLGKRAEFTLSDRTISALLHVVERSVNMDHPGSNSLAGLAVILLSLNTATAVATVGIENQLCALFLMASPDHQRILLPLVHRSFYSQLRVTSLSAASFDVLVKRQALDSSYHEFLRVFALVHSSAAVLEEFITVQLLGTSPYGAKPMFGSPPIATGLSGARCCNNRMGPAADMRSADKKAGGAYFTVLYWLEALTAAQVHHCYVVSAFSAALRRVHRRTGATPNASVASASSPESPTSLPPSAIVILTRAACEELVEYLQDIFGQVSLMMGGKRCSLFCGKKGLGLKFVEGVLSDCLYLAKHICVAHRGTSFAEELSTEVTSFLYSAMRAVRVGETKLLADELPEVRDAEVTVALGVSSSTDSRAARESGRMEEPLFSPDIMIKALEFQIAFAPIEEVLNFFEDIFGPRLWHAYLEKYESFPLELCLALERNATALSSVLPSLAPRVMWLLSHQPHILFPVVKRLIVPMMSEATSLDIFFRIVFLPLICFSNTYAPPPADADGDMDGDDEDFLDSTMATTASRFRDEDAIRAERDFYRELWRVITDWTVDQKYCITPFAELCLMKGKSFDLWNALHRSLGVFDGQMTVAYRLIRPLLTEYFKAVEVLPPQIFSALRTAFFFLVSPQHQRSIVTDFLLEMGRWVAEVKPILVQQSTGCLVELMQQDFIPPTKRSWQVQRWASMVAAVGLSQRADDEVSLREAAIYFEVLHIMIWELVALASTAVSIQYQAALRPTGHTDRDVCSAPYRRTLAPLQFASTTIATAAIGDALLSSTPHDGGLAADFLPEAQLTASKEPGWADVSCRPVWVTPKGISSAKEMCGVVFTEHMHSLVIALSVLSQICPNVKERGIICLANLVRTLMKSRHAGTQLATTATLCLKLLRYPSMRGLSTMPLHALLGLQVLRDSAKTSSNAEGEASPPLQKCL